MQKANENKASPVAKTVVDKLIKTVEPILIYCRHFHLLIVFSDAHTHPLKHYEKQIKLCSIPKKYTFSLHQFCELERQCRAGSLFLSTFCIPANLIYEGEQDLQLISPWQRLISTRERALFEFGAGMKKAKAFYEGACYYWAKGDPNLAAFMLHQATELCFRTIILIFTGEEVRTHTISELLSHCRRYASIVTQVFPTKTEKDQQLFTLLEQAYSSTRYTHVYAIHEKDLQLLLNQIKQLHTVTDEFIKETLRVYLPY